ncbi:50S ribosomal protein L31 [Wolbachia endosymbiont of Ctenocephalides felis wCfeT]|uniref:50S ribosomal protein L31 n=1 Tax=Wolbachia endosymbiont of Ctenocephalides felis wCfeT TaxID=2732593 RepID=UPI001445AEA5|nr:50S ribosomal protein L31 [Wolbachia endosymbiont of Ctenocephalides felis wCfeT]
MAEVEIDYHKIIIIMTDGQEFETLSTYGKEGDRVKLDRDPLTHPAWTGSLTSGATSKTSKLAKFNDKYGDIF